MEQLSHDLARASDESARLKEDLAAATKRELSLKHELAGSESRTTSALRDRDEALLLVQAAREEREQFLGKLIEAERIRQAGQEVESLDLAAFISGLRAEVLSLRAERGSERPLAPPAIAQKPPQPPPALRPGEFRSTSDAAETLLSAGRLGISDGDRDTLRAAARFETRSEETLFTQSLRELSSRDGPSRMRAAQRLKALGPRAASPAIAAALNAEPSPEVAAALLLVLGASQDASVLPLVRPHLSAETVEVRLAALEAVFRLGDPSILIEALSDPSPLVRRRAAVLAASSNAHSRGEVLVRAAHDDDASVRRVAVLGVAAALGEGGEPTLLLALDDADPTVRRSAAKGLSRSFGPEVFAVAGLDPTRRKREIRRLQNTRAAPAKIDPSAAPPSRPAGLPLPARAPISARDAPTAPRAPDVPSARLEADILSRVFASLRGQSLDELSRELSASPESVRASALALEGSGRLLRRGQRFFVP